jgi:hypothetical protein
MGYCPVAVSIITAMTYHPDDGGSKHLWNVGKFMPHYTAQYHRRQSPSVLQTFAPAHCKSQWIINLLSDPLLLQVLCSGVKELHYTFEEEWTNPRVVLLSLLVGTEFRSFTLRSVSLKRWSLNARFIVRIRQSSVNLFVFGNNDKMVPHEGGC